MKKIIVGSLICFSLAFYPITILVFHIEPKTALPASIFIFVACMLLYWLEEFGKKVDKPEVKEGK